MPLDTCATFTSKLPTSPASTASSGCSCNEDEYSADVLSSVNTYSLCQGGAHPLGQTKLIQGILLPPEGEWKTRILFMAPDVQVVVFVRGL